MSNFRKIQPFLPLVFAILVLIAGVLAWKLISDDGQREPPGGKALVGGPFSLTDHTGKRVTEKDFAGQYMLVFFGYTYCPDVCPIELQIMTAAMELLPKRAQDRIQPIFITVDPVRDTVPVMAEYVANFHPKLIGLTGTEAEIAAAAKAYRVYFQKAGDGEQDYLMDHSSIVFLMSPTGDYVSHFSVGVAPEDMARRLQDLVK